MQTIHFKVGCCHFENGVYRRDQSSAAPTAAAPSTRATEPAEAADQPNADPEDAKIKGWADMLVKYSQEKDLEHVKTIIRTVLLPRNSDPAKVFEDILLAAVNKREVGTELIQVEISITRQWDASPLSSLSITRFTEVCTALSLTIWGTPPPPPPPTPHPTPPTLFPSTCALLFVFENIYAFLECKQRPGAWKQAKLPSNTKKGGEGYISEFYRSGHWHVYLGHAHAHGQDQEVLQDKVSLLYAINFCKAVNVSIVQGSAQKIGLTITF